MHHHKPLVLNLAPDRNEHRSNTEPTHMKKKGQALPIAFKQMLSEPGIWKRLRLSKQTIMNRRVQVGKGAYPKDTTMRAWLKKAGWKLESVETWVLR